MIEPINININHTPNRVNSQSLTSFTESDELSILDQLLILTTALSKSEIDTSS